ncbi:hypothetical protein Bca4012_085218 [Brassica carinata]
MVVVDQAASRSVSKNLYLLVYEVLVAGFLRCFLRVLGGGGLVVVWPRAFTLTAATDALSDSLPVFVSLVLVVWKGGALD